MMIYFYLFIPLLFVATDSSSIRGRNNKNDLMPFVSSRTDPEKRGSSVKTVSSDPLFLKLRLPNSGEFEAKGKDKKKKRPMKNRISKIKFLKKRQRIRRELPVSNSKLVRQENSNSLAITHAVNATERLQNVTNAINRVDILKALSTYSKNVENKTEDKRSRGEAEKLNRNHHIHHLSEKTPLVKMVYPSTPKSDKHPHKYTYKDLVNDRERLEQKIKYIKNMLSINDSAVDDNIRVRRRSDSDRAANRIAKMFLTLSAVNGLHDKRKSKCEEDDEDRVQDIWEKERRQSLSRKSSSSNEERYKVKKWIEFMKNKRSSGKTCPCMAAHGEDRDVFPLEQKLPKGYFLMERRESSEDSSEAYRDPMYSLRDKPNRESYSSRRLNKNQEDQDAKVKGAPKNGKKKPDTTFTDLELYRSRAKQILRNAEEILDRIKEEEEKRLAAPNLFMSRLRELTSRIQGDPRNNENDLIRKLQKNLGWGPLARSEEGEAGNQFLENVKSYILDPYEKAKALTDESTKKLSSYLLRNLGKLQEASEEQVGARESEDEVGKDNLQSYFERMPTKDEKPLPDNLAKEDSTVTEKVCIDKEEPFKQRMEDIIKEQRKILEEYEVKQDSGERGEEADVVGDKETETVRENQKSNFEDKVAMNLNEHDTDRSTDSREKAIKSAVELEKVREDLVEERPFLHPEGNPQGKEGDNKVTSSGNLQTEKKHETELFEEIMKTSKDPATDDQENVEKQRSGVEVSEDQNGEALTQRKHDSLEGKEQDEVQEVVASSQTTSEVSERQENDVMLSPHLKDDYDFLNVGENEASEKSQTATDYDPSWSKKETSDGNDQYIKAENPVETDSINENQENSETEKEAEPGLGQSKELSNVYNKEIVNLKEPEAEFNRKEESSDDEEQDEEAKGGKELLEYSQLVKDESPASDELSTADRTRDASPENKSNEELKEINENEETVNMRQSDNEDNQSTGDRTDRAEKGGETLLKLASGIKDFETEKSVQDDQEQQSFESDDETPLKAENLETPKEEVSDETFLQVGNFETPKEESGEETFLKETFENGNLNEEKGDDVPLGVEQTAEKSSNEKFIKNAEEESNDEVFLKERKEAQNSEEVIGAKKTEEDPDLREESIEENDDEKVKATEEDDEASVKAIRVEVPDEDIKNSIVESPNKEDNPDSESLHEISPKVMPEVEENLKSENVLKDKSNQESQEQAESSQEDAEGNKSPEENLKSQKVADDENNEGSEALSREQENLESETVSKAIEPKENLNEETQNEDADNEAILRAENTGLKTEAVSEETSKEIQASNSQENLEEEPEGKQDSWETVKASLENETRDVEKLEGEEALKAANPEDEDLRVEDEDEDGNDGSVKAIFDVKEPDRDEETVKEAIFDAKEPDMDQETVKEAIFDAKEQDRDQETVKEAIFDAKEQDMDQETVKEAVESEIPDNLEDDGTLKAENPIESIKDESTDGDVNDQIVKEVLDEGNSENLGENEETLKAVKSEENLETDDVVEAMQDSENTDSDEAVLKEAKSDEELEQKVLDKEKSGTEELQETTNEDETPLRAALNLENLEKEDETLQAENANEEQKEADIEESPLRSASIEDELDNKIEDESPLRSANPLGDPEYNMRINEESLTEDNKSNEVSEGETLRAENFIAHDFDKSSNEDGREALADDSSTENAENPEEKEFRENIPQLSDLLQIPEATSKSLTGSALKVPKSIGKIMSDLEGQAKDDITSIQSLNPQKIDQVIDKLDEAEQNLLVSQELDCEKECACAEGMNARFKNIGRYEIVKDFLHWMKDLQLNRVLSDN